MNDALPQPDAERAAVIVEILAKNGPLDEAQLLAELTKRGMDLGSDPGLTMEEALEQGDCLVTVLADGRWAWLPTLLSGRVFTHRLTRLEVEHDVLTVSPDLAPVQMLTDSDAYRNLADGAQVTAILLPFDNDTLEERGVPWEAVEDDAYLLLPPGHLKRTGAREADVIGLRLTQAGLTVEVVEEPVQTPEALATLSQRLGAVVAATPEVPVEVDTATWTACADDPNLFGQPLPPLETALDACGFARHGDWVAVEGFDFGRWRTVIRCAAIARRYDLSDDEALAVLAVVTLYDRISDLYEAARAAKEAGDNSALELIADERAPVKAAVAFLADPTIAQAVLAETVGPSDEGAAALGLFAETLEQAAPLEARPALRWLRAKAHERLGQIVQAEETYLAAESLDPRWPLTLVDLARYAGDRGDAARGLALLRRAGIERDDLLVELLERFQATPRSDLGRNQPCWCGSGLKYKKCHLHNERLPLDERAGWLYQKAGTFLCDGAWNVLLIAAAETRARNADTPEALRDAMTDPLVTDAVLFEGGAFDEFLAVRGGLLPDDERMLADQWLLIERSVYEVEQVRPGDGLTLRDLRTGDVHEVHERTASRQIKAGQLVCGRVVPTGDTMQIFGGIEPVELHQRDALIDLLDTQPDALELIAFLTRRFAPAILANTEGDPFVLCDVTLHVSEPGTLSVALDETYDRGSDAPQWIEHVTTHGMQRIRAMLRLEDDKLHINVNSEARLDRVLATLRELDPSITVLSEAWQPLHDAREASQLAASFRREGTAPAPTLDPADPEVAAMLDEFTRNYEQKWLDEPIPALAGHTPREAAADPTRRDDLIRLLDTFPVDEGPGSMSPDRLRAALGLPS